MLKPFGYLALIGGTALLVGLLWFASFHRNHQPELPQAISYVGEFELQRDDGAVFTQENFRDRVTVVDTMFTRCTTVCPLLSAQLVKLQALMKRFAKFQIVSISIDPENDKPEVLKAYGESHGANPKIWSFVTGKSVVLQKVVVEFLKLGMPDEPLSHSESFVLVDSNLGIRGFYSVDDADDMIRLQNDVFNLLKSPEMTLKLSKREPNAEHQ